MALVTRVIDGDTIEVLLRGREVDVRLIGIDTPETVHPSQPVECFGRAASNFTDTRLEGTRVRLEFDLERKDRYGRTLAYVWNGKQLFNQVLVRQGYAQVSTYPPNDKYVDRFLAAQRAARSESAGLWRGCPAEEQVSEPPPASGGNCDPSYSGQCLDPDVPDYDCASGSGNGPEYVEGTVRVIGSDHYGLDADGDGYGCE